MKEQQKKKNSTQELLGFRRFTKYGIETDNGEMLLFEIAPINISVLSYENVEIMIRHLQMAMVTFPNMEIFCTDACEYFDENKAYLHSRIEQENNPKIRMLLQQDIDELDNIQSETSTTRQFTFGLKCDRGMKDEQILELANKFEKTVSAETFEIKRMKKADIKRILAIYFDVSKYGDLMPDYDGNQYTDLMLPTEQTDEKAT